MEITLPNLTVFFPEGEDSALLRNISIYDHIALRHTSEHTHHHHYGQLIIVYLNEIYHLCRLSTTEGV